MHLFLAFLLFGSVLAQAPVDPEYVLETFPHQKDAFCQGLIFHDDGFLYEGTGLYGSSSLRKVHGPTGTVVQKVTLDSQYFGEGITIMNGKVFQLTWKSKVGFIYNVADFSLLGTFTIRTTAPNHQGWGLTHNSDSLIVSDGTSNIYFWNPDTFMVTKQFKVIDSISGNEAVEVDQLNELEYVPSTNEIYANIWQTDLIVRFNADTGAVLGFLDLSGLKPVYEQGVLNCIARVPYEQNLRLFVTGKNWGSAFVIDLLDGEPTTLEFAELPALGNGTTFPPTTANSGMNLQVGYSSIVLAIALSTAAMLT